MAPDAVATIPLNRWLVTRVFSPAVRADSGTPGDGKLARSTPRCSLRKGSLHAAFFSQQPLDYALQPSYIQDRGESTCDNATKRAHGAGASGRRTQSNLLNRSPLFQLFLPLSAGFPFYRTDLNRKANFLYKFLTERPPDRTEVVPCHCHRLVRPGAGGCPSGARASLSERH